MAKAKTDGPKRHLLIPDTQTRPGVPLDNIGWIAQAIVDYKPDVVVHLGDHWDFPSCGTHDQPGSAPMEGKRFRADIETGNESFAKLSAPMAAEIKRTSKLANPWKPRKVFIVGNHETRADRMAESNPKLLGTIGSDQCETLDWERHEFLKIVEIDGILYSHYFQNSHSGRPIGGTIQNKLSKIGASFAHGHVQGLDIGTKIMGSGKTYWGVSAGSAYLHEEPYRGAQGQRHWRGLVCFNEVQDGEHCPMVLSLDYLCRKYEGMKLRDFMCRKYQYSDWGHLQ